MAASAQCFYLGLKDEPVDDNTTSSQINKVGGRPDWTASALKSLPELSCPLCSKQLLLALQIYSPLDRCDWYHRTLYIFCCINPRCWNKQGSWRAIRSQERSSPAEQACSSTTASPGVSSDWLAGQDDWDSDSWGSVPSSLACSSDNPHDLETCLGSMSVTAVVASPTPPTPQEDDEVVSGDSEMEEAPVEPEPVMDGEALEAMTALKKSELERSAVIGGLLQGAAFKSYYIAVVEENPLPDKAPTDAHARKLLQDFEAGDGNAFRTPGKGQGGTAYAQESYEKASYHDAIFHKFHKRLQRCPRQLIRFCWEGAPLFVSQPPPSWEPSKCESCGARRCFELQAMPALIQSLEVEGCAQLQGPAVEFGTVLFYSCRASCWKEGDTWLPEVALVQPDPDAAFWDRLG